MTVNLTTLEAEKLERLIEALERAIAELRSAIIALSTLVETQPRSK